MKAVLIGMAIGLGWALTMFCVAIAHRFMAWACEIVVRVKIVGPVTCVEVDE